MDSNLKNAHLNFFDCRVDLLNTTCQCEVLARTFISMPWRKHSQEPISRYSRHNVPQIIYLQEMEKKSLLLTENLKWSNHLSQKLKLSDKETTKYLL